MSRLTMTMLIAATLAAAPAVARQSAPAEPAAPDVGRVWLRVPKDGGIKRFATRTGQLEFGDTALRFVGRKKTIELPYASLHTVSFGHMDGDVDTRWTVLELLGDDGRRVYGLRDGRKFGFGQRTPAIHERIVELVRRHGAAQYGVPPGAKTYDRFDWQFTTALPEGWAARVAEMVYVGDRAPWGTLVFVPGGLVAELESPGVDEALAERIRAGRAPAVTIERRAAPRGAGCDGIGERARATIASELASAPLGDPVFGETRGEILPRAIDGCDALRLSAPAPGGATVEVHAVVHGDVLYVVGRAGDGGADDAYRLALERLRFAKAR